LTFFKAFFRLKDTTISKEKLHQLFFLLTYKNYKNLGPIIT